MKKLNQVGAHITAAVCSINENYLELSKINSSSCEILYTYGKYLMRKEVMHINQESYNRMTAPLLVLTPHPTTIPRISAVNLMFTEVTGFQREELIDSEVTKVAPRLWQQEGLSSL